jgi:hypothetical protein
VAVTVQRQTPAVTLDEEDRIVGVGPAAEGQFGPLVGSVMWECYPGSEPLFKPYYDTARRTGEPVRFVQFYDGNVSRITAVPAEGSRLELSWELLMRLDTTTLESFVTTLRQALELLELESVGVHRDEVRKALRVIEGGR